MRGPHRRSTKPEPIHLQILRVRRDGALDPELKIEESQNERIPGERGYEIRLSASAQFLSGLA